MSGGGTALAIATRVPPDTQPARVVIVRGRAEWPPELLAEIGRLGLGIVWVDDVRLAPFFVLSGGVTAVILDARSLDMGALVALRECREQRPSLAVVVVAPEPDTRTGAMKQALDSGATSFLSWPASPQAVKQAIERCS